MVKHTPKSSLTRLSQKGSMPCHALPHRVFVFVVRFQRLLINPVRVRGPFPHSQPFRQQFQCNGKYSIHQEHLSIPKASTKMPHWKTISQVQYQFFKINKFDPEIFFPALTVASFVSFWNHHWLTGFCGDDEPTESEGFDSPLVAGPFFNLVSNHNFCEIQWLLFIVKGIRPTWTRSFFLWGSD